MDKNTMSSEAFSKMQFTSLGLKGKWLSLIGDPSERWNMMVWSKPGKGKSTLMIEFAKYLAYEFGKKVLYVAKEEGFGATLKDKFVRMAAIDPLITIASEMPASLGGYNYVVIDSVTSLKLNTDDLTVLTKKYPTINFIFIFQATVDGNYRGDKEAEHLVDVSIVINEQGMATCQKTRFGGKGTVSVFDTRNQIEPGVFKFTGIEQASAFISKPENSGMRIVFGQNDREVIVCSSKKALEYRSKGYDIM